MSDELTPPVPAAPPATDRTFTQSEVNALLADERRKTSSKYADYDDLKAARTRLDEYELTRDTAEKAAAEALSRGKKAAEEAEAAKRAAEATVLRYTIAGDHGLTPAQARWLSGDTDEEIRKSLKSMRETFGIGHTSGGPRPSLAPGGTSPAAEPTDMNAWLRGRGTGANSR